MLQIIHTNDFHENLKVDVAAKLLELKTELGGQGLLLDAGDAGGSGNITYRAAGEPILTQMNEIGYDAMTVGNRDFHLMRAGFEAKLALAKFPVLCANVRVNGTPSLLDSENTDAIEERAEGLPVSRWIVRELPECRVVVFGVTVAMITEKMLSRKVSHYLFDAPLRCAERLVPMLVSRFRPDLLIALTHIGYSGDLELAERVPGIDLIVGGHSHTILPEGERVGETLIVQAGSRGSHVGIVEIERGASGKSTAGSARLETL